MSDPIFLSRDHILLIQRSEAQLTNSPTLVRDQGALEAAIAAPQASFDGQFLMDVFQMAATYVVSISKHHPFLDGNKRTAAASALVFLRANGFVMQERYDEELADKILALLSHEISKEDMVEYFRQQSTKLSED